MSLPSVSTLSLARQTRNSIRLMQGEVADRNQELSTGRRIDVAGSIGSRTATLVDLRNARAQVEEFRTSLQAQGSRLTIMQNALAEVRGAATKVRDLALSVSGSGEGPQAGAIDEAARDALQVLQSMLNTSQSGRFLFAGIRFDQRPVQPQDEVGPSGLSPRQAVAQAVAAAGPITAAADVDALIDGPGGLTDLFTDANPADPASFSNTFFLGSTQQVVGRAGDGLPITYRATGGDPAMRDLMQGLHLLAGVPHGSVPGEAYTRVAERGWQQITAALDQLVEIQGVLGLEEEAVDRAARQYDVQATLISTQVVRLEEADPYETSLRLNTLQTQLEASLSITARISRLSLVDFL
ncbi:MAG: putative flagellar hook-associated protein 3 FlgL [Pseudomonadota bacterium]|jgi:flagellar hook-associated protein 3 FlgL